MVRLEEVVYFPSNMASPFGRIGFEGCSTIFGSLSLSLSLSPFSDSFLINLRLHPFALFQDFLLLGRPPLSPPSLCPRSWPTWPTEERPTATIRTIRPGIFQISPGSPGRLVSENRRGRRWPRSWTSSYDQCQSFLAFASDFFVPHFASRMRILLAIILLRPFRSSRYQRINRFFHVERNFRVILNVHIKTRKIEELFL